MMMTTLQGFLFVNRYDPRKAIEFLKDKEQKGEVQISLEQPSDHSKPITVTVNYEPNTFLLDSNYPPCVKLCLPTSIQNLLQP